MTTQGIEARSDETRSGAAEGESPVPQACAKGAPTSPETADIETIAGLAARCEAATGPNRELDQAIWFALFGPDKDMRRMIDRGSFSYTSSLDAAMTLTPEGWGWLVSQPNAKALASGLLKQRTPVLGEVQNGCDDRYSVAAATPALALCCAALRARADHLRSGDPQ